MRLDGRMVRVVRDLHWARGVRAGLAVSVAMGVCFVLGRPMGWAALGGFEAILVDNGGPYRTRLTTIATLLGGGAVACVVASLTAYPGWLACGVAALFCFWVTYARVIAQPIASTSVIILVIYFAGVGAAEHTLWAALGNARDFVLGGAWAAALSLMLWPVDPFRPARLGVVQCYRDLGAFLAGMTWTPPHSEEREAMRLRTHGFQRTMRLALEQARSALGATAARSASRTVRARSLTVLLETADMLFATVLRWTELMERAEDEAARAAIAEAVWWLGGAADAVAGGLANRPADGGASYAPEGSHSMQYVRGRGETALAIAGVGAGVMAHLGAEERDALQNVEIAFEAVRAIWSGMEVRGAWKPGRAEAENAVGWWELLRSNWTADSVMLRHAARMGIVAGVDVLAMRRLHVSHGSWLAMTSIIVLQPYGSGTIRKSAQRVGGTVAGGVLAALLAAAIHSKTGILVVITLTSVMTLATYAVDYGWYAFFLTPTFVLMSLPHLRDWRFAGVRMGTTVIGAGVALLAMWVLWPEREEARLGELLGRAAIAEAEYVRAVAGFWRTDESARRQAERTVLAPARRSTGLRILDAEEALDRMMQEPGLGRSKAVEESRTAAMSVITYLRRLARSATMLAAVGEAGDGSEVRMREVAERLEAVGKSLTGGAAAKAAETWQRREVAKPVAEQQMRRVERQVEVIERSAAKLPGERKR